MGGYQFLSATFYRERVTMACITGPSLTGIDKKDNNSLPDSVEFEIPFPSSTEAEIAYNSLKVDSEPKRGSTIKLLTLEGNKLNVSLTSGSTRQLRTALSSFLDLLILVTETIDEFGDCATVVN